VADRTLPRYTTSRSCQPLNLLRDPVVAFSWYGFHYSVELLSVHLWTCSLILELRCRYFMFPFPLSDHRSFLLALPTFFWMFACILLDFRFRFRHRCFASGILRFPIWIKSPRPIAPSPANPSTQKSLIPAICATSQRSVESAHARPRLRTSLRARPSNQQVLQPPSSSSSTRPSRYAFCGCTRRHRHHLE
jgi:hypothetical protein